MADPTPPQETGDRKAEAMRIVHRYVMISAAAGLINIPVVDVVTLGGVHIALIKDITEHYGGEFSDNALRNVSIAIAASLIPGSIGSVVGRAVLKALPFIPTGLGFATMSVCSAGLSYAIGVAFIRHFESGGTIESFDAKRLLEGFSS